MFSQPSRRDCTRSVSLALIYTMLKKQHNWETTRIAILRIIVEVQNILIYIILVLWELVGFHASIIAIQRA